MKKNYKKPYPVEDCGKYAWVQFPVEITEAVIESAKAQDLPMAHAFKIGWYVAVNVMLPDGYRIPPNSAPLQSYFQCQKGCDIHNHYYGFSKDDVEQIVSESMGLTTAKS